MHEHFIVESILMQRPLLCDAWLFPVDAMTTDVRRNSFLWLGGPMMVTSR